MLLEKLRNGEIKVDENIGIKLGSDYKKMDIEDLY